MTVRDQGGHPDRPVAAAVIVVDGRVLLVRRQVPEGPLLWQFPGGRVELGETAERTAVREVLEETGLTVRPTGLLGRRVHPLTGATISYVSCDYVTGQARLAAPREISALTWSPIPDLDRYIPDGVYEGVRSHLATAAEVNANEAAVSD